jgi:hypothetical protein
MGAPVRTIRVPLRRIRAPVVGMGARVAAMATRVDAIHVHLSHSHDGIPSTRAPLDAIRTRVHWMRALSGDILGRPDETTAALPPRRRLVDDHREGNEVAAYRVEYQSERFEPSMRRIPTPPTTASTTRRESHPISRSKERKRECGSRVEAGSGYRTKPAVLPFAG